MFLRMVRLIGFVSVIISILSIVVVYVSVFLRWSFVESIVFLSVFLNFFISMVRVVFVMILMSV